MRGQLYDEDLSLEDYRSLGEFRYRIRRFLHFSEAAAREEELEPQQHQILLAIRAAAEPDGPTIGVLAEHLLIRHHSAVGLIDRLEEHGLVARVRGAADRRQVRVHLTPAGEAKLSRLAAAHRAELASTGPLLVEALRALLQGSGQGTAPPHGQKAEDDSAL
jgi:DNA-binding MarR family transcriptional regulator